MSLPVVSLLTASETISPEATLSLLVIVISKDCTLLAVVPDNDFEFVLTESKLVVVVTFVVSTFGVIASNEHDHPAVLVVSLLAKNILHFNVPDPVYSSGHSKGAVIMYS